MYHVASEFEIRSKSMGLVSLFWVRNQLSIADQIGLGILSIFDNKFGSVFCVMVINEIEKNDQKNHSHSV